METLKLRLNTLAKHVQHRAWGAELLFTSSMFILLEEYVSFLHLVSLIGGEPITSLPAPLKILNHNIYSLN